MTTRHRDTDPVAQAAPAKPDPYDGWDEYAVPPEPTQQAAPIDVGAGLDAVVRANLPKSRDLFDTAKRSPTEAALREEPPAERVLWVMNYRKQGESGRFRQRFFSTPQAADAFKVSLGAGYDTERDRETIEGPAPAPSLARLHTLADRWEAEAVGTPRHARELREALAAGAELPGLPEGWSVEDRTGEWTRYGNGGLGKVDISDEGGVVTKCLPGLAVAAAVLAHHLAHASKGGAR